MKNKITFFLCLNFICLVSFSQNPWTEEKILWTCPSDASLKITYRINNLSNEIEINGPIEGSFFSDKKSITGILKMNSGTFDAPKNLDPNAMTQAILNNKPTTTSNIVQSTELIISGLYSKNFLFYPDKNKTPEFSFEGNCGKNPDKNESELSEIETKKIFDLFFGANASKDFTINNEDKKQAKILFTELIKKSCEMAIIENVTNLDETLLTAFRQICKSIGDCNKITKNGSYYETVRKAVAFNFVTNFQIRKATGEW